MKSRLLLILVIAVFAQAKTMAADTMSPQVFRDTVIVQSDSVSHHHRCVIKSLEERSIVGIDFGKLEGFNTLPGNIATSVYPNYGKLNGAIIVTTENSKLKKK